MLTVKVTEAMKNQMQGFERAWYRLVNGDTSQTLDYALFKDVSKPDAVDGSSAGAEGEGEEGADAAKQGGATYTYVAGRIFYDNKGSGRWVYEAFNNVFSSERFG